MRRVLILFFISGLTGLNLTRCKSIPIQEKIIRQEQQNEEATDIAQKYIPVGKDRQTVVNALKNSSELLRKADQETQKAQAAEKAAEADASKWHWVKGIGITLGVGALAFCGLKMFRLFRPV